MSDSNEKCLEISDIQLFSCFASRNSYRTWENFGGVKFWRIWRLMQIRQIIFLLILIKTLKLLKIFIRSAKIFLAICFNSSNSPKFYPSKIFPCMVVPNCLNVYTFNPNNCILGSVVTVPLVLHCVCRRWY